MPSFNFHEEKIKEVLIAYKSSEALFVKGVSLFYIAVHAIDYCLSKNFQIDDIATHRGRKKRITENFDEKTSIYFNELLAYSLSIRYNEITQKEIVESMKKALKNLIVHLNIAYNFPTKLKNEIEDTITKK